MKDVYDFILDIYFDEINTRERIVSRIQVNLAIFASVLAILSYMARRLDYSSGYPLVILFWIGEFSSLVLIGVSIFLTYHAFTGFEYKFFPKAKDVIAYKRDIARYIDRGENIHGSIEEFMIDSVCECVDNNYALNEFRRKKISFSLVFLVMSGIPIFFTCFLFVVFDMDASSPRKDMLIVDRSVVAQLKELTSLTKSNYMNNQLKEGVQMSDERNQSGQGGQGDQNRQGDQGTNQGSQTSKVPPLPPLIPPKIQISTENFKGDKGKETLNE